MNFKSVLIALVAISAFSAQAYGAAKKHIIKFVQGLASA